MVKITNIFRNTKGTANTTQFQGMIIDHVSAIVLKIIDLVLLLEDTFPQQKMIMETITILQTMTILEQARKETNEDKIEETILEINRNQTQYRDPGFLVRTKEILETTTSGLVRIREGRTPAFYLLGSPSLLLVQWILKGISSMDMELLNKMNKMLKVADQDKLAKGGFLMLAIVWLHKVFNQEQILLGSPSPGWDNFHLPQVG